MSTTEEVNAAIIRPFVTSSDVYKEMNKKYGPYRTTTFPRRLLDKNYKKDVLAVE